MTKQYVVEIGYEYYQIDQRCIGALLDVTNQLRKVNYANDYINFVCNPENDPLVRSIRLCDVIDGKDEISPVPENGTTAVTL